MMSLRRVLPPALAAGCLTAAGCGLFGGGPKEPPPPLVYSLCLDAGEKLNWYNDTANTLYVRIYQLSTPDTFVQADPTRMVAPDFTLAGAEGAPVEKTLFPGTKTTVEIRQQPDATALGVVAFYYQASGPVKTRRRLPQRGEEPPDEPPPCVVLGAGGIENP